MNVELEFQENIYDAISILLSKADCEDKASAYVANFLQQKIGEDILDSYDYTIRDMGADGFQANVEFSFKWNIANLCVMIVYPKISPAKAFDRAMDVI